ncbi:MAG: GTPase domain-containing protein [Ignavibacteriales bacterium]|nr:GTPase domain-containing protein [Ignavibacteriales bacterium]
MQEIISALVKSLPELAPIILWVVTVFFASILVAFFLDLRMPRPYNVAIIGLPGSGKTTLIIALFREILAGRIKKVLATLSTRTTNERVMKSIALLDSLKPLGPTQDQDMFAYRTNIVLGSFFRKTYKVEFADFPGEESSKLEDPSQESGNGTVVAVEPFLNPEFARWVNEADAFVFVVDVARCFIGYEHEKGISKDYTGATTEGIRTAWQNIVNEHTAGSKRVRSIPVVLVYAKSDLINHVSENGNVTEAMLTWGYKKIPDKPKIDSGKLSEYGKKIAWAFSDVRKFFQQSGNPFYEIFTSSYGVLGKEDFVHEREVLTEPRMGLSELLQAVLPAPPS